MVGKPEDGDPRSAIGPFGYGTRNATGDMLVKWAMMQKVAIPITCFDKRSGKRWARVRGEMGRQMGHVCVGQNARSWVIDAEAIEHICLGTDHRAVTTEMRIPTVGRKNKKWRQGNHDQLMWLGGRKQRRVCQKPRQPTRTPQSINKRRMA